MSKEQAVKYIATQGYKAILDTYGVVMVHIKAKHQKTAQKEFNALRKNVRDNGYAGSIGYQFCEVR